MMDFDNILDLASQNQGLSNVQKRYSLQTGPPKKDPRSKNVNPAAVQALLNKQHVSAKKKEMEFRKEKEDLLAKRVEMKSDRKARAMASRTKDNFKGYNGVPTVEIVKKRRSKSEMQEERSANGQGFRDDPDDDEDNYEYEQTDSDSEPEPLRKVTNASGTASGTNGCKSSKQHKPGQHAMNFADLLKLAEKKQFEPVDLKPKIVKKEQRLRTAEEIRELEMERKAKRTDKKTERGQDGKSGSSSTRASTLEKEKRDCKPQKNSIEKTRLPSGSGKKLQSDPPHSSSKISIRDKERSKICHSDGDRPKSSLISSCGATNSKNISKISSSQVVTKQRGLKPSLGHKSTSSDLSSKREGPSSLQGRALGIPGTRPVCTAVTGQKSKTASSQQARPSQSSSVKLRAVIGVHKSGKGEPPKSGTNSLVKSNGNSAMRNSSSGPPKAGSPPHQRSGGTSQAKSGAVLARPGGSGLHIHQGRGGSQPSGAGVGRLGSAGPVPGRSTGTMGTGPGRPKCTVVSETISSKNVGGARPGVPPRPGMTQRPPGQPRPGMPPRPMMNRPPGPMLPPITSAYKRKFEDEDEYDSEMDDFIDDGGEEQQEISRHIREIFGYDRNRYKDESDYALKFMESSWKDMQKEEARSLKMAVYEDQEEERREEEDMKMKSAKRTKKN